MKKIFNINLLAVFLLSFPVMAIDGIAIIDMRTAVLSTQAATDAFKLSVKQ
jgi:outer membrane protein